MRFSAKALKKLWPVRRGGYFGRVLAIRWLGQITDGIFQSGLASFVLFSPERQANAVAAALAFAVVLIPYSFIGPFAGIFLDRFSRQRIVQVANLSRALLLILIALMVKSSYTGLSLTFVVLIAFGINRLILAGLSAGLPLVVTREELIGANALAVTGGSIGVVIGGGIGIGVKNLMDRSHSSDYSDFTTLILASVMYFLVALIATRLPRKAIGPHEHEVTQEIHSFKEVLQGFHELRKHRDAFRGIFTVAIQRGGLTALTLTALLLERNTFNPSNSPDAGLRGFAYALAIAGVGIGIGSFISPFFVSFLGRYRWIRIAMAAPTPLLIIFAFYPHEWFMIVTAFFVGGCGQAVKVTNDALVQSKIHDEFRGRVFAFYDVVVNGLIVTGAIVAALILPTSGKSVVLPLLISGIYLITASAFAPTMKGASR